MFNKRDDAPASPHQPAPTARRAPAGGFSVIGPDMVVTGNVRASADLHVKERVDGDLSDVVAAA